MSAQQSQQKPPEEKKPRGRPRKTQKEVVTHNFTGISQVPRNENNVMEFVFTKPFILKKLLNLDKFYEVDEIELIFDEEEVRMSSKDHWGKVKIYKIIDCKSVFHYYTREMFRICVKREYLEKIFSCIDKNECRIAMTLSEDDYRSHIRIKFTDSDYNKDKTYTIEINHNTMQSNRDEIFVDKDHALKFVLDSKHFKTEINQMSKLAKQLTIQQMNDRNKLQFTFDGVNNIDYWSCYNDKDRIRLKSSLPFDEDSIIRISIPIAYIMPFSKSCIGDEVHIAADKNKEMSMTSFLDKRGSDYVIMVKVYTQITDLSR